MQKIIREMKTQKSSLTEQEIFNLAREYIQTLVLKFIYQSKYGGALSFMGGTALRMCYNLKRYSEDLDFALDDKKVSYDFSALMELVKREMTLRGFDVSSTANADKTVQKGFLHFAGLGEKLGLNAFHKQQKLHVKIEVDVHPVLLKPDERESFFVNRFQEIFPILKHTLSTLFAGKVLALLYRPYDRGRDYYDLIWYLSQKVNLNLGYLNRGSKEKKFKDAKQVFSAVGEKVKNMKPAQILKDMNRFLEDPSDELWIKKYQQLYEQLMG